MSLRLLQRWLASAPAFPPPARSVNRTGFQDWLRNFLDWRTSCSKAATSKAATRFSSNSISLVPIASSHLIIVRHNRDIKLSRSADCMFSFIGTSITVRGLFGNLAKRGIFHDPGIGEDDIELAAVFFDLRENVIELVELRDSPFKAFTFLPMSLTAEANSASRRPVLKT